MPINATLRNKARQVASKLLNNNWLAAGTTLFVIVFFVAMGLGRLNCEENAIHENTWAIYDVFREAGYNDNAIAGILGRVQQENNFDTGNVEEYDDAETGLHLGGYGMFQWNGERTTAFLNWAKENNFDPQNARVQAKYALLEAKQRGLTPEKMNSLSYEDAATLWTDKWEVGEHGNERKYAKKWAERIAKVENVNSRNNTLANNVDTSLMNGAG